MIFYELPGQKESWNVEGHLMPDQVQMRIGILPKYAVAHVVGYLKGKSAFRLRACLAGEGAIVPVTASGAVDIVCRRGARRWHGQAVLKGYGGLAASHVDFSRRRMPGQVFGDQYLRAGWATGSQVTD
jgi:REP element-mobilizing transposase RayT